METPKRAIEMTCPEKILMITESDKLFLYRQVLSEKFSKSKTTNLIPIVFLEAVFIAIIVLICVFTDLQATFPLLFMVSVFSVILLICIIQDLSANRRARAVAATITDEDRHWWDLFTAQAALNAEITEYNELFDSLHSGDNDRSTPPALSGMLTRLCSDLFNRKLEFELELIKAEAALEEEYLSRAFCELEAAKASLEKYPDWKKIMSVK